MRSESWRVLGKKYAGDRNITALPKPDDIIPFAFKLSWKAAYAGHVFGLGDLAFVGNTKLVRDHADPPGRSVYLHCSQDNKVYEYAGKEEDHENA